jgi:hypothetical protein
LKRRTMTTATKQRLYRLIYEMPDDEAERLLLTLEDRVSRALALTPVDAEGLTAEELAMVEEAQRAYRRGEWVPGESVRQEVGW